MIIRALDSSGDWTFGSGKSSYKKNELAFNQDLATKLLEWKGDCFFNNDAGVDWKNRLDKRLQASPLQDEIRTVILKTDGIKEIVDLNLDFNSISRNLTLTYSVKTVFSTEPQQNTINI